MEKPKPSLVCQRVTKSVIVLLLFLCYSQIFPHVDGVGVICALAIFQLGLVAGLLPQRETQGK